MNMNEQAQRVGRVRRVLAAAAIVTAVGGSAAACDTNPDCAKQVPRSSHCSGTWF